MGRPASGLLRGLAELSQRPPPGSPGSGPGHIPPQETPELPGPLATHRKPIPVLTVRGCPRGPSRPARGPGPASALPHWQCHLCPHRAPLSVCSTALCFIHHQTTAPQQPVSEEVGWLPVPPQPPSSGPSCSVPGAGLGSLHLSGWHMTRLKEE